ncbi:hypothetical protein VNO77_17095 [Canavalia gladiata]|uniref:Protein FAR1-RELATED SEQUENCE n=1 Tax=Canavalia gladiata TaxID=3824 RepID=A0AAN9LJ31_CANGL
MLMIHVLSIYSRLSIYLLSLLSGFKQKPLSVDCANILRDNHDLGTCGNIEMSDQCVSHTPLDINFSGCEENLTSHLPEECKHESVSFNEVDAFPVPQVGMVFSSEVEVRSYYTEYAKQLGFRIITRTSKKGRDGKVKYLILECSGEAVRRGNIAASRKQYCEAKINVTSRKDGTYRINTVTLSHNHELSSDIYFKDIIDMRSKTTLDKKNIDMHACVTKSPIEQQFQSAYTHAKFLEVQHEFVGKADCNISVAHIDNPICHYNVIEDVIIGDK